jgi:long-chain acyl-CoA synthetase
MDRFWLKQYPEGVPHDINPEEYGSIRELMEKAFKDFGSRTAYECMGASMTYAEVDKLSQQVGAWLQAKGLPKGARVAAMMPNVLQYPAVMFGILRAGYVVVNVNPLYTPRELEHQLNDSGAEAIFILENFANTLEQVIDKTGIKHTVVAAMGDLMGAKGLMVNFVLRAVKKMVPAFTLPNAIRFKQMVNESRGLALKSVPIASTDVAFLQYTGGTTGVSKGATLTNRNIVANVLQSEAWSKPAYSGVPESEQKIVIVALPLYHIFALTVCCLLGMRTGTLSVLVPNPRDIPGLIKVLAKRPFHTFPAVNTLYNAIANHPDAATVDWSKLKVSNGGGMAVQQATADKWLQVTRCAVIEGYGLSETSPSATCNPANATVYSGSIGLPLPSTEIAILDDDGKPVPLGTAGEIAIRGPQVMAGYWNRADETAKVMTADGFFKSGDVGIMDERGYTKIVDRKKDMILVSGFNVYPNEIEQVVNMHPKVLECAAVGVPDAHSGEAVKLFVVKKEASVTEADIKAFCEENLTGYKRPRSIVFRADLPKTNVGKILRRTLRDEEKV